MRGRKVLISFLALTLSCSGPGGNGNGGDPLFSDLGVGFGDRFFWDFYGKDGSVIWMSVHDLLLDENIDTNYADIDRFDPVAFKNLQGYLRNSRFLVFWLTKGWRESWFDIDQLNVLMSAGYVPVFMYWYFGDSLDGVPSDTEVEEFMADVDRVILFLRKLKGRKILIFEPEFNVPGIVDDPVAGEEFAGIMETAVKKVRSEVPDVLISLCMMDSGSRDLNETNPSCGFENCALGDIGSWIKADNVYSHLITSLDFICFQQMVSQLSRDPSDPSKVKIYTDEEIGIDLLPERILNLTEFLRDLYGKPVLLGYIAVASGTWTNGEFDPRGWDTKVVQTFRRLREIRPLLKEAGMFGYIPMMIFDHPQHDEGGYHFFLRNEHHLGIVRTSAEEEVDLHLYGDIEPKGSVLDEIYR
ncbi:MAG: hypothetical protein Q9N26_06335 [Aquificota bacterium]|nr:hypothetical protein [Aquificota bacterium]